jgi:hypothetical protein
MREGVNRLNIFFRATGNLLAGFPGVELQIKNEGYSSDLMATRTPRSIHVP